MATSETVQLNLPHQPHPNALEAFEAVLHDIKNAIVHSRHHWDKHEPMMWARAHGLSDAQLTEFHLAKDLIQVRSGPTSYGTIIFGKLRIPAVHDAEGEGFVHVRIHDPPNKGTEDVMFHSIFTYEGQPDASGHHVWRALHTKDTPLEFFNE